MTVLTFPLRRQVARGGRSVVSAWRDCSERYSCTNATWVVQTGTIRGCLVSRAYTTRYTLQRYTVLPCFGASSKRWGSSRGADSSGVQCNRSCRCSSCTGSLRRATARTRVAMDSPASGRATQGTTHSCHDRDGHEDANGVVILLDEHTQNRRSKQQQDEWVLELLQVLLVEGVLTRATNKAAARLQGVRGKSTIKRNVGHWDSSKSRPSCYGGGKTNPHYGTCNTRSSSAWLTK